MSQERYERNKKGTLAIYENPVQHYNFNDNVTPANGENNIFFNFPIPLHAPSNEQDHFLIDTTNAYLVVPSMDDALPQSESSPLPSHNDFLQEPLTTTNEPKSKGIPLEFHNSLTALLNDEISSQSNQFHHLSKINPSSFFYNYDQLKHYLRALDQSLNLCKEAINSTDEEHYWNTISDILTPLLSYLDKGTFYNAISLIVDKVKSTQNTQFTWGSIERN